MIIYGISSKAIFTVTCIENGRITGHSFLTVYNISQKQQKQCSEEV